MLKKLAALSVLAVGSVAAAFASPVTSLPPVTGSFSITGLDGFNATSITFGQAVVAGTPTGSFSFLTGGISGNPVTMFPALPIGTPLPYAPGFQTVLSRLGTATTPALTTTQAGITVQFLLSDYTTTYDLNGQHSCIVAECLTISGNGIFTETGYANTPGVFAFTTQETADNMGSISLTPTTFSASGNTAAAPEPSSLFLFGTGILGLAGVARRKITKAAAQGL